MNKQLEFINVSLTYQTKKDEIKAIEKLSFNCNQGEFLSIIGPSGCGKTSILSLIAGLITPSSGKIIINGKDINKDNAKIELGYMLQKDQLFPWRTIEKNVFLPLEIKGINTKENKEYALHLLEKYGLIDFRKNYPSELSGGMRQRVALIRTLAYKPQLLLLDEPFSALDSQTRLSVCDDVYSIIKLEKKTAILVTHDISEAISMSDKIIVLSHRPAQVKSIFRPNLNGGSPLRNRESKDFGILFEKVWKELI
ncbi:MAG: ABC transporter ATP-binding protein [Clostridiales bacterium]|nr:ABC transporter ATP-binding protein [Clostridiales bacterium]